MEEKRALAEWLRLGSLVFLLAIYLPADLMAESLAEEVVVPGATPEAAQEPMPVTDVSRLAGQLRLGMTYHEIVKLLGAPSERKEMEAKRSAVWEYGSHKIFFREGRVVAWTSVEASQPAPGEADSPNAVAAEKRDTKIAGTKKEPTDEETIRSLLGEIMDSSQAGGAPSSAESKSPEPERGPEARAIDPDRASLPPLVQQLSPY